MKQLWAVGVREYFPGRHRIRVERVGEGTANMNMFDMAGTEGTHGYTVYATVEASATAIAKGLTREQGWKQPGESGQDRFSATCGAPELHEKLGRALKAVGFGRNIRQVNPDIATVAEKLGVKANGRTAAATVTSKLMRLAAAAKAPRRKAVMASV